MLRLCSEGSNCHSTSYFQNKFATSNGKYRLSLTSDEDGDDDNSVYGQSSCHVVWKVLFRKHSYNSKAVIIIRAFI